MKKVGTYIVRDPNTGAIYIGSTGNFDSRQNTHTSLLRHGKHPNENLQVSVTDITQLVWDFTPTEDRATAYELERKLLVEHADNPLLCNKSLDPTETIADICKRTGAYLNGGDKRSATLTGVKHTDERRANMSAARKGKPKTPEWSEKIAEATRIRIEVDGVVYQSASAAAEATGASVATTLNRARNPKFDNWKIVE